MPVLDEQVAELQISTVKDAGGFRRYLSVLAGLVMLVYAAGFMIVRLPSYARWGGGSFGPILEYGFQTAGQNADVLVFGDSSAIFALDPVQMGRELGVKVVNLPNTIGSLPVVGDMSLKRYLVTNRPPRLILFYFCLWDLDYTNAQPKNLFEGEQILVRYGSSRQILKYAVHHPREVFYFPFRVYSQIAPGAFLSQLHRPGVAEVTAYHGHVSNTLPYEPLTGDCRLSGQVLQNPRIAAVQELMTEYSSRETRTMLYLAPVPGCQNIAKLPVLTEGNLGAAPPVEFSPENFSADGYYAHLRPEAVARATMLAAEAVRAQLKP